MPQEHQRIKTRHAGSSKRAFCTRLPQIFSVCKLQHRRFPTNFPNAKDRACHTERLEALWIETCWDVTLSAAPAARNDAARSLKHPKVTTFAAPARGTAIANSSRTVADGSGRLQAASSEHVPTPDPQSKTRTLRYAVGKNTKSRTPFGTSGCCFEDRRCPNSVLPPSFAGTALEATVFQNPWQFRPPRPVVGCNGLT
jgi:hypothetical protein